MRLGSLLTGAGVDRHSLVSTSGMDLEMTSELEVADLVMDSREVTPGCIFAAVAGERSDGHLHAGEAVASGASVIVCERELPLDVPQVVVPSVRSVLGPLASELWGRPSEHLKVVGVTGTNGKTTTCAFLGGVLNAHGWPAKVLGTLSGSRTTPEAPILQRQLAHWRTQGAAAVAMEVSSHALVQRRVDATRFAAAVFTNLSQDHLDFHGTMESYFEAKAKLFEEKMSDICVVNISDDWGQILCERLEKLGRQVVRVDPTEISSIEMEPSGSRFIWRGTEMTVATAGRLNVLNALCAAVTAEALGVGRDEIAKGLASVPPVRGRFEPVDAGQSFTVLVDYAHTPEGLAAALRSAREMAKQARLIIVLGAGGQRDSTKRPAMGEVATRLADLAVLTTDNPRGEDPQEIIEQVARGAVQRDRLVIEPDRSRAIAAAIAAAEDGDVVIVAGKGHETYQDFGDRVETFDDVVVAREALERIVGARRRQP